MTCVFLLGFISVDKPGMIEEKGQKMSLVSRYKLKMSAADVTPTYVTTRLLHLLLFGMSVCVLTCSPSLCVD